MNIFRFRRLLRTSTTALVVGGLAAIGAVALATAPATPASAAEPAPICPPDGGMPPIDNLPSYTDANVAVYAGGDYLATGAAAESEGLLLVRGSATFDKAEGGIFNVGAVGVGSGITPPGGDTMLAVGGELDVVDPTRIDVGHNVDGGGAVHVGGAGSPAGGGAGQVETNGAEYLTGLGQATAMAPYADFQDVIVEASSVLAATPSNGATQVSGNRVTFTGGDTGMQVFAIDAATLGPVFEVFFENIPENAPILVNVTGGPLTFAPGYFDLNGERVDDFASPNYGNAASQIMWNIADATALSLTGASQIMGSFLAPAADATITASTNGRVHIGGNLTTSGVGNEQHNYPWIGGGPFDCGSASFDAVKVITGSGASAVPDDAVFTLQYSYELEGETVTGELLLPADGTAVDGPELPEDTVVTFTEIDLPEVDGIEWGQPVIDPSEITIGDDVVTRITVTNTADAIINAVGGFSASKRVEGDAADQVPTDTVFALAYSYELDGEQVGGELSLPVDGTVVDGPQDLPTGTVVSFEEVELPAIDGIEWGTPELSASTVTIAAGTNVEVTVTNTATPVTPAPTPIPTPEPDDADADLAETGFSPLVPMTAAALALLVGAALFVVARRRKA
ncbi:choice-of-anchor A family protein [Agromyces italicus]|uniref:choice-of-anchor A family protein n=1 Tax=Agromyces italicus TaxID=279572 RepID=UPI00146D89D5|nr:choice-of-anchor A family protein [Agromyces italicus]